MSGSDHGTHGSGGAYCSDCASPVGEPAKAQPTTVDGEVFCPRCFVWKRMHKEPARFNAAQACAARCQFCGWLCVCFGALPGRGIRCSHCGRYGAVRVQLTKEDREGVREAVRDAQLEAAKTL